MLTRRPLGKSGIAVSAVAMGCWPIAGITSRGVTESDSLAALQAAVDAGINFFDTAWCYGYDGESERLIARALGHRRSEIVIATKGGIHWNPDRTQARDARPETLKRECHESLQRLQTDHVDLLYLHAPDPQTPLAESAGALKELLDAGLTRSVGVSNVSREQLIEFARICPISAYQPHYNMLQREIEASQLPWCRDQAVAVCVYWPLLKGLLAGKLPRDQVFAPGDGRLKYPMFRGEEWQRNQDLLDRLRSLAAEAGRSVAELVIAWTIEQPGITVALCGAKRPDQILESARALTFTLSPEQRTAINDALQARGEPTSRAAV